MKKENIEACMAILLLVCVVLMGSRGTVAVTNMKMAKTKPVVVIDAGHGGADPGKIGINNALEKDINLSIAMKLKEFLEAEDIEVVMTRKDDKGLYDDSSRNKKVQDMQARCAIINETAPVVTVSIHQNSYHEEYVKGAQVFYFSHSEKAKALADIIQEQLIKTVQLDNKRVAKANDSYYLLKKTDITTVIVECGFLSNYEEAAKLTEPVYQEKVAWAVHMGVLQYINSI